MKQHFQVCPKPQEAWGLNLPELQEDPRGEVTATQMIFLPGNPMDGIHSPQGCKELEHIQATKQQQRHSTFYHLARHSMNVLEFTIFVINGFILYVYIY